MPKINAQLLEKRVRFWLDRAGRRWPALIIGLLVLLGLAAAGGMAWFVALPGFAVMAGVVLAWPEGPAGSGLTEAALPGQDQRELAWHGFAEALPDPCLILDRHGFVAYANAVAGVHFPSLRAGEPMTVSFRHPALLRAVEAARRSGAAQTVEMHQTVPNETWHRVTVAPLGPPEEGFLLVTLESLTEARQLEAMRRDFVANASHELRTPLASLSGAIDTLLGPAADDPAARARFLDMMRGQADRMSKLIDDLLSLSRIELRQHVRPAGRVELGPLLREIVAALGPQAEAAGIEVKLSIADPPATATATGEREELYEVFENLLDNAIKYGGEGGRVDISLVAADRPGFAHKVSVIDHGAGIPPEHVPRLTERFYRVDADSSRKKKGTGLGLAIVKHIVARHRGQLVIASRLGEGTRVDVYLPD